MTVTILLVLGFGALVVALPLYFEEQRDLARRIALLMLAAYATRMLILTVATYAEVDILTGGDAATYEYFAWIVARGWMVHDNLDFVADGAGIGSVSLPINLFALIFYAVGEPSRAAGTALIAGLACVTVYNLYALAVEFGAEPRFAFRALALQLFIPGYLVYTSNTFKDGTVAFLAIAAFGAALRLSRKLSVIQAAIAVVALLGLYYTRFYMVVMTGLPVLASLVSAKHGGVVRRFVVPSALLVGLAVVGSSRLASELSEQMENGFNHATEAGVLSWNAGTGFLASQGSGVTFDDGGDPFSQLGPKTAYTLFSPFPWMGGSFALQVGKVDALIWYYLFYRLVIAGRRLWREDRSLLVIFASFLIPSTIAYATTMANVGLIVRQRIPIVMVGTLLAMLSWPKRVVESAPEPSADGGEPVTPASAPALEPPAPSAAELLRSNRSPPGRARRCRPAQPGGAVSAERTGTVRAFSATPSSPPIHFLTLSV